VTLGGASYTILDYARYWPDAQPRTMYWGDSRRDRITASAAARSL